MSTSNSEPTAQVGADRDALVERLRNSAIGALELYHVYLGESLGLYRLLAAVGPLTPIELASAAGIDRRYAREWLEEQAVAGILLVGAGPDGADDRRYSVPAGHAEVLSDPDSLSFLAPLGAAMVAVGGAMQAVREAFKSGGGVAYEHYGPEMRGAISRMNRPMFLNQLGDEWLRAIPDVHQRLSSQPPARVADVGCGTGWSAIGIAKTYPNVDVHGFDVDEESIADARRNAQASGVTDRVTFEVRSAADSDLAGLFDLVTAFETIHDMSDPVGALRAMRRMVKPGGAIIIGDERVAEEFTAPGDETERLMYGWSAVHCLPVGMVDRNSAATGTVMRPSVLREYARKAGFVDLEVLPIRTDFWTFYRPVYQAEPVTNRA